MANKDQHGNKEIRKAKQPKTKAPPAASRRHSSYHPLSPAKRSACRFPIACDRTASRG